MGGAIGVGALSEKIMALWVHRLGGGILALPQALATGAMPLCPASIFLWKFKLQSFMLDINWCNNELTTRGSKISEK